MSRRALTAIGTIGPFGTEGMAVAALVGVAVLVDMVVWTAVVTRNVDGNLGAGQIVSVLLLPALDAGLVVVAVRVVLVAYDQAAGPRAIAIGAGAQLAAHLAIAVIALTGWQH